jgi:2-dehydro-3-deoxyphosphogluconate aldolase/(4S)-4-hydroxy-2-oxoglutarate aldolase
MDKTAILSRINACGAVAIARVEDASELIPTVEALINGGVDVFEVTMSVPGAIDVIRDMSKHFGGDVLLGAGTVLDSETARAALLAGAEFLVTPCITPGVIEIARRYGKVVTPGALTPTEVLQAWQLGGDIIKVFPAHRMGPGYIRDVRAPLPQIPLMPTGGINIDNAADYIKAGAVALGMSWLLDKKLMAARQFDQITDNARRLRDVIEEARH